MGIPHGLWTALQQYLLTQPMGEVEGLVNGLRQAKPVEASIHGDKDTPTENEKIKL